MGVDKVKRAAAQAIYWLDEAEQLCRAYNKSGTTDTERLLISIANSQLVMAEMLNKIARSVARIADAMDKAD